MTPLTMPSRKVTIDADEPRTARSATFRSIRSSTHMIPTPGVHQPRPQPYEPPQIRLALVNPAAVLMVALGIGLEIALHFSQRNNGFGVPEKNVFSFASTNFIASFVPTLLVAPLVLLWASSDFEIRRYQPYIGLAKGNSTARESILLDYVSKNKLSTLWTALRMRHWLLLTSTIATLLTLLIQPLAGAIFEIDQIPESSPSTTTIIGDFGLNANIPTLAPFISSAGFVQAAVANNLTDPPFVYQNWSIAEFRTADIGVNSNVTVNTIGILTDVNCSAPVSLTLDTPVNGNYTITAQPDFQCDNAVHIFNPTSATQQYGVISVPNCQGTSNNGTFAPVFFWFFHFLPNPNGSLTTQAAGTFCHPSIAMYEVQASQDLSTNDLIFVEALGPSTSPNNITTGPQNGQAFNGVIFDFALADAFVQARATATASGVPAAILTAGLMSGANVFGTLDGFLNVTNHVYTEYLALLGKTIYFVPTSEDVASYTISLKPRLVIDVFPAHFLSVLFILVGIMNLGIQILHKRARKHVWLADSPGSIGMSVALTAHSGLGDNLWPYDTLKTAEEKLQDLRFRLDERTGAIVVEAEGDSGSMEDGGMNDSLLKSTTPPLTATSFVFEPFNVESILRSPNEAVMPQNEKEGRDGMGRPLVRQG